MGEVDRVKKRRCTWDDGKTEKLPSVPRALSFPLSPASKLPTRPMSAKEARSAKEASAEERGGGVVTEKSSWFLSWCAGYFMGGRGRKKYKKN